MPHRVHHEATLAGLDFDQVLAAVKRDLADTGLPLHRFAHHRERFFGHFAVRRKIIRPLQIDRIDRRVVGERLEVDHPSRIDAHFLDVLVFHDDVASLLELVSFYDVSVRYLALALWTPALLLNARLTLGVQLVEAERGTSVGRREDLDRNVHQADL